jgi:hypothetical protein
MKIFLCYVGDLGFQLGVAEDLEVHQTTVPQVIADIATKVLEKVPLWIKFPSTEEEFEAAKAYWQVSYKFACAIGVLDCTHISIRRPSVHGDEYINRKVFQASTYKQRVAVENCLQVWTFPGQGQCLVLVIWRNSYTYRAIRENTSHAILLADEGNGLAPQEQQSYSLIINYIAGRGE